jgi:hypothetical protein
VGALAFRMLSFENPISQNRARTVFSSYITTTRLQPTFTEDILAVHIVENRNI